MAQAGDRQTERRKQPPKVWPHIIEGSDFSRLGVSLACASEGSE